MQTLMSRCLDEALTDSEKRELEAGLLASAGARDAFRKMVRLHALMEDWGNRPGRDLRLPTQEQGIVEERET